MRPIVCNPKILGGKPVIEGTRMSVEHILGLIGAGMTAKDIVAEHPVLSEDEVLAAVRYAREALQNDIVLDSRGV